MAVSTLPFPLTDTRERLPTRRSLLLADVLDLPFVRWPRQDGTYPDGPGPEVRDHERILQPGPGP